jgi:hypothetical protein
LNKYFFFFLNFAFSVLGKEGKKNKGKTYIRGDRKRNLFKKNSI